MNRAHPFIRGISTFLTMVLFTTNCLFAHFQETNFWKERSKSLQLVRLPQGAGSQPFYFPPAIRQIEPLAHRGAELRPHLTKWLKELKNDRFNEVLSSLSNRYGTIRGISIPTQPFNQIIVHVQDVHMNLEAQRNISDAIQDLVRQGRIDLIALEGAFRPIDLSAFREFPHQPTVNDVAEYLLNENKISGPIHAALVSSVPVPFLTGIDDPSHYRANVNAVKKSAPLRDGYKATHSEQSKKIAEEKENFFNLDLLAFDRLINAYRTGKIQIGEYAKGLQKAQVHLNQIRPESDPRLVNVPLFLRALELEESLDFSQVEAERSALIGRLVARLKPVETHELADLSAAFRLGYLTHADFYQALKNICEKAGVPLSGFKSMASYIQYVFLADSIDSEELLNELRKIESSIYRSLAKSDREKEMIAQSRQLYLTGKLLDFALTKEEWNEYKKFQTSNFRFQYGLKYFEAFYAEAEARDQAMAENLLASMKKRRSSIAVLVTGGFHAKGMLSYANKGGIAIINFVPKLTKIESEKGSAYLSVFTREKTPLEKLFEGEKLFLTPEPISPRAYQEGIVQAAARAVRTRVARILTVSTWLEKFLKWKKVSVELVTSGLVYIIGIEPLSHRRIKLAVNDKWEINLLNSPAFSGLLSTLVSLLIAAGVGHISAFGPISLMATALYWIASFGVFKSRFRLEEKEFPPLASLPIAMAPNGILNLLNGIEIPSITILYMARKKAPREQAVGLSHPSSSLNYILTGIKRVNAGVTFLMDKDWKKWVNPARWDWRGIREKIVSGLKKIPAIFEQALVMAYALINTFLNAIEPFRRHSSSGFVSPISAGFRNVVGTYMPLFQMRSKKGWGVVSYIQMMVGVDIHAETGQNAMQLPPLRPSSAENSPYSQESTKALEELYIDVQALVDELKITGIPVPGWQQFLSERSGAIRELNEADKVNYDRVRWLIHQALQIVWPVLKGHPESTLYKDFITFRKSESGWLEDYALYAVLKDKNMKAEKDGGADWNKLRRWDWRLWVPGLRDRRWIAMQKARRYYRKEILFKSFAQFVAARQLNKLLAYAKKRGVEPVIDIPFTADGADLWLNPKVFGLIKPLDSLRLWLGRTVEKAYQRMTTQGVGAEGIFTSGQYWQFYPFQWLFRKTLKFILEVFRFAQLIAQYIRSDHVLGFYRTYHYTVDVKRQLNLSNLGVFEALKKCRRQALEGVAENNDGKKYRAAEEALGALKDVFIRRWSSLPVELRKILPKEAIRLTFTPEGDLYPDNMIRIGRPQTLEEQKNDLPSGSCWKKERIDVENLVFGGEPSMKYTRVTPSREVGDFDESDHNRRFLPMLNYLLDGEIQETDVVGLAYYKVNPRAEEYLSEILRVAQERGTISTWELLGNLPHELLVSSIELGGFVFLPMLWGEARYLREKPNPFHLANHVENAFVTGTLHDSETMPYRWEVILANKHDVKKNLLNEWFGEHNWDELDAVQFTPRVHRKFLEKIYTSPARIAIVNWLDILGLGESFRINVPGQLNQWVNRLPKDSTLEDLHEAALRVKAQATIEAVENAVQSGLTSWRAYNAVKMITELISVSGRQRPPPHTGKPVIQSVTPTIGGNHIQLRKIKFGGHPFLLDAYTRSEITNPVTAVNLVIRKKNGAELRIPMRSETINDESRAHGLPEDVQKWRARWFPTSLGQHKFYIEIVGVNGESRLETPIASKEGTLVAVGFRANTNPQSPEFALERKKPSPSAPNSLAYLLLMATPWRNHPVVKKLYLFEILGVLGAVGEGLLSGYLYDHYGWIATLAGFVLLLIIHVTFERFHPNPEIRGPPFRWFNLLRLAIFAQYLVFPIFGFSLYYGLIAHIIFDIAQMRFRLVIFQQAPQDEVAPERATHQNNGLAEQVVGELNSTETNLGVAHTYRQMIGQGRDFLDSLSWRLGTILSQQRFFIPASLALIVSQSVLLALGIQPFEAIVASLLFGILALRPFSQDFKQIHEHLARFAPQLFSLSPDEYRQKIEAKYWMLGLATLLLTMASINFVAALPITAYGGSALAGAVAYPMAFLSGQVGGLMLHAGHNLIPGVLPASSGAIVNEKTRPNLMPRSFFMQNAMDAGFELINGEVTYRNSLRKITEAIPRIAQLGYKSLYLYGGLFKMGKITVELHQVPETDQQTLESLDHSVFSQTQGYKTRREEREGGIVILDKHGNSFSPMDMRTLNPLLSEGDVEKDFEELIRVARKNGMKVVTDWIPWRAPDAVSDENYQKFYHRRLSEEELKLWKTASPKGLMARDQFIINLLKNNPEFAVKIVNYGTTYEEPILVLHSALSIPHKDQVIPNIFLEEVQNDYIAEFKGLIDRGVSGVRIDLIHLLLRERQENFRRKVAPGFIPPHDELLEPLKHILYEVKAYAKEKGQEFIVIGETYVDYGGRDYPKEFVDNWKGLVDFVYHKKVFDAYTSGDINELRKQLEIALQSPDRYAVFGANYDEDWLKVKGGARFSYLSFLHFLGKAGLAIMVDFIDLIDHFGPFIPIPGVKHPIGSNEELKARREKSIGQLINESHVVKNLEKIPDLMPEAKATFLNTSAQTRFVAASAKGRNGDWVIVVNDFWTAAKRGVEIWVSLPDDFLKEAGLPKPLPAENIEPLLRAAWSQYEVVDVITGERTDFDMFIDKSDGATPYRLKLKLKDADTLNVFLVRKISEPVEMSGSIWDILLRIRRCFMEATRLFVKIIDGIPELWASSRDWFTQQWGRAVFISMPGLLLATGRFEEARNLMESFASLERNGLIPNRIHDRRNPQAIEYNTADASMWFIQAVKKYVDYTGDVEFAKKMLPTIRNIIQGYENGSGYDDQKHINKDATQNVHRIFMDANDGLIVNPAGATWMDANPHLKGFVTPRNGKAVEINALWYANLRFVHELLNYSPEPDRAKVEADRIHYRDLADKVKRSFNEKFWNEQAQTLFDVIEGDLHQGAHRDNGLVAISHGLDLLSPERQTKVFEKAQKFLMTPYGPRSLDNQDSHYKPHYYTESQPDPGLGEEIFKHHKDFAYHQGTVWPYRMGIYVDSLVRVRTYEQKSMDDIRKEIRELLEPLTHVLLNQGTLPEVFDAEPREDGKRYPGGTSSQAWSVAEVFRVLMEYKILPSENYTWVRPPDSEWDGLKIRPRETAPATAAASRPAVWAAKLWLVHVRGWDRTSKQDLMDKAIQNIVPWIEGILTILFVPLFYSGIAYFFGTWTQSLLPLILLANGLSNSIFSVGHLFGYYEYNYKEGHYTYRSVFSKARSFKKNLILAMKTSAYFFIKGLKIFGPFYISFSYAIMMGRAVNPVFIGATIFLAVFWAIWFHHASNNPYGIFPGTGLVSSPARLVRRLLNQSSMAKKPILIYQRVSGKDPEQIWKQVQKGGLNQLTKDGTGLLVWNIVTDDPEVIPALKSKIPPELSGRVQVILAPIQANLNELQAQTLQIRGPAFQSFMTQADLYIFLPHGFAVPENFFTGWTEDERLRVHLYQILLDSLGPILVEMGSRTTTIFETFIRTLSNA